ncbi:MAG: RNA 2',3'-cyclic phosphodiesterase [Pseudomonadales bacterium]|nr:RNA 2',3'-cyclic phosphodiesterase [Pseudomonadales bacterium]
MRCFVGVPVIGALAGQCKSLSLGLPRAIPRSNLHMTLGFLGEQTPSRVKSLSSALELLCASQSPFELVLQQCEPFPGPEGPFLALVAELSEPLAHLHGALWACLEEHGVERETRPFRPHITLARPGMGMAAQRGEWRLQVDQICLYQSELVQGGPPGYRPLSQHRLVGG